MSLFKKNYTLIYFIFFILSFLLFLNINSFAEEEVLEFPYDPEEKATEMKIITADASRAKILPNY